LSAEHGDVTGQLKLAETYYSGKGVAQNFAEAARWWRKAADQGDDSAQAFLGNAYFEGKGVAQDFAEAARWWRKAADQGNTQGQAGLTIAYDDGLGVTRNAEEAYFWANLAATLSAGNPEMAALDAKLASAAAESAARVRESTGATLHPDRRLAVQKRCRQWLEAFEKRKAQKR
jgi:TPR repeat protein